MAFSGLKIQITIIVAVLLTVAVTLGNLVAVVFWQKGMVRTEVEHARAVLESADLTKFAEAGDDEVRRLLAQVGRYAGRYCYGTAYFDGEGVTAAGFEANLPAVRQTLRDAALSRREVVRLEGDTWSVFSLGKRYLLVAHPAAGVGGERLSGAVLIVLELESIYKIIQEDQKIVFVYLLVNILVLTIIGVFRLIRLTVRPVERLIGVSEGYEATEGALFQGAGGHSEFGRLTMALNAMLMRIELDREQLKRTVASLEAANRELKQAQKEMVRTEKMAAVGRLSAGLAHEIGNPVGIVQGYLELLADAGLQEQEREQFVRRATAELERVSRLIRKLLDFAGSGSQQLGPVRLGEVLEGLVQMVTLRKTGSTLSFNLNLKDDLYIWGDEDSLRQVFLNCLLNGIDAIEAMAGTPDGVITVSLDREASSTQEPRARVVIEDNGFGIDEEIKESVFDPFFTTKEPGRGTGLGLFVSYSIVEAHGGRMALESEPGAGTRVVVTLPIHDQEV